MNHNGPKARIVYQKWIFERLVMLDHNFLFSRINRDNPEKQIYYFEATEELERDIVKIRKAGKNHDQA